MEVWPENWPAVRVFIEMGTQWRMSMSGPIGLDYTPLFHRLDRLGLEGEDWEQCFSDVRQMEADALAKLAEQHKDK